MREVARRHDARLGVGFLDGRAETLALALPDVVGKRRLADHACRQRDGLVEQFGIGEAAQREAGALVAGADVELGAEIGPGLAECVLVHGRRVADGANALLDHVGADTGEAGLRIRVTSAAGIEVELHVNDGQGGDGAEVDLGAVRQRPVLDRYGGIRARAAQRRSTHQCGQGGHGRDLLEGQHGSCSFSAVRPQGRRAHAGAGSCRPAAAGASRP